MKPLEELLGSQFALMEPIAGTCEAHGDSTVTPLRGQATWCCTTCLMAQMEREKDALWKAERMAHLHLVADIPHKCRGQRFISTTPAQRDVRATVKRYRDFIIAEKTWAVLALTGTMGTGKTLLACELGQALIDSFGWSVRYITAKGMIGEIQASYGKEGKSEESEIDKFVRYELLILDEIDVKSGKENANLLLGEVVNRRYNHGRPMIAISNQLFDQLGEFVGDRVHDRMHENAFICAFDWGSYRRQT